MLDVGMSYSSKCRPSARGRERNDSLIRVRLCVLAMEWYFWNKLSILASLICSYVKRASTVITACDNEGIQRISRDACVAIFVRYMHYTFAHKRQKSGTNMYKYEQRLSMTSNSWLLYKRMKFIIIEKNGFDSSYEYFCSWPLAYFNIENIRYFNLSLRCFKFKTNFIYILLFVKYFLLGWWHSSRNNII